MPLAGRPPYATDEPDLFYQTAPAPHRRLRQPVPPNPNDRSSAYDVYNHYLSDDNAGDRRSGVNALGLGLMNMVNDDDDDNNNNNVPAAPPPPPSKHAALAAAVAMPPKRPSPPPQHIVAPRPGYAAPIATLNLARPEPVVSKDTSPINFKINSPPNPFADPHSPHPVSSSPPMMSNEPHPLQSPVTPITPVFARPKPNVTFSETAVPRPPKPIVRGNSEDTLLPGRGEKGDDFWRRFSMVVKEENRKSPSQKTSLWLRKTQDGSHRLARWVWITGIVIVVIIAVAAVVGYHLSHNTPSHQQPTALGGSANEAATVVTTSTSALVNASGSTIKHVSPTYTLDGRELGTHATAIPAPHKRRLHHV